MCSENKIFNCLIAWRSLPFILITDLTMKEAYCNMLDKSNVRIKIEIIFIFRFHRRPIKLVVFFPVSLSSLLRYLLQVLLGVEVFSVARATEMS